MKKLLGDGRADFLAGLALVLPVVMSLAVVLWLFGAVSHFTDTLLVLVPGEWIRNAGGAPHLYFRVFALLVAILLVGLVGRLGRYYFGKKLIEGADAVVMRVPLFNRLYTSLKQIHEALTSTKAASFKQVVLVEFPRRGLYSIGFITGAQSAEAQVKTQKRLLCVFVPAPPLTSGAVLLVPEADLVKLEMSVADGLKFIMSLGSVSPAYLSREKVLNPEAVGNLKGIGPRRNGEADWTFVSPGLAPKPVVPSE